MEYYGTIGPSCCDRETLTAMFRAGMTGMRLNLSHRKLTECEDWIRTFREAAAACGVVPRLMIDLQGPEVRIGELPAPVKLTADSLVELREGEDRGIPAENREIWDLGIPAEVRRRIRPGMTLLLDDGTIRLKVVETGEGSRESQSAASDGVHDPGAQGKASEACGGILCRVETGGTLRSRKSLAIPGLDLHYPTLTEQDYENLAAAEACGVTEVMLPFVRGAEDVWNLRRELDRLKSGLKLYAKIENLDGVEHLEEILPHCDCVVIARGDLGNAVPLPELPVLQQKLVKLCRRYDKPRVIVTQMLNSMIQAPVPTRAEVNDIFHAVADGSCILMLTGETAAGRYPVEAMSVLVQTGEAALRYLRSV